MLLIFGCAGSYLTQSRNFSNTKRSYHRIAVIGVSKSYIARTRFEESVANKLQEKGVTAIPSFNSGISIPMEETLNSAETATLNQQLLEAGFDGALVTNLVNTSEYTDVIPGSTFIGFYPVRYGRFGRYTAFYPIPYWETDRLVTGTTYVLETCLYALDNGQEDNLKWAGMFELKNPRYLNSVTVKYAAELTEALLRESIATGPGDF
ncbi:MAG: hypothetical protein RLZZ241_449 [Bacteroidota bacterium]